MRRTGCCGRSTRRNTAKGTSEGSAAGNRAGAPEAERTELFPGSLAEVTFSDLLANGQAVGRIDGLVIFVTGPLPGERVLVRVASVKAKYAVGDVVAYVTTSAQRVEPFCPVFGVCGGCQVQHLAYPAQLAWKEQVVRNALQRIGGFTDVAVEHPVGMAHPRAYRNKMSLVVQAGGGSAPRLGFYQARSHELVPIEGCPVVVPQLDAAIAGLGRAAADPRTAAAFDDVKHAIMRVGTASGQAVLSLTTDRHAGAIAAAASDLAAQIPGVVGISNSFEPRNANAVLGRKMAYVWGAREMEEAIEGVRFRVSPASFFQVNSEMVGRIFRFMEPGIAPGRKIVDLYCGAGTFAIFFATRGARVVGVEENPAAVREANLNAELNGVTGRARFIAGRVEGAVADAAGRAALQAADVVFLDPPRKGSDEATLDAIAAAGVGNVWYLSCNPATLARDLRVLQTKGYLPDVVQPFDMFPQTGHVETFVTVHRRGSAPIGLPPPVDSPWRDSIPSWSDDDRSGGDDLGGIAAPT